SREDERRALGRLVLALDEHGAAPLEVANDVGVVDDLLADVHRRAVQLQRLLDRLHGPLDTGAVPAGRREKAALDQTGAKDRRGSMSTGLRTGTMEGDGSRRTARHLRRGPGALRPGPSDLPGRALRRPRRAHR